MTFADLFRSNSQEKGVDLLLVDSGDLHDGKEQWSCLTSKKFDLRLYRYRFE